MSVFDIANERRISGIADAVCRLLPDANMSVLDVGCGDGALARQIMNRRPALAFEGVEVVKPATPRMPISLYDGNTLPCGDGAFDVVLCADMLHHTTAPFDLLREACRVAKSYVVVKDHVCNTRTDKILLTSMDWLGNVGKGVPLPFHFLSSAQWADGFASLPYAVVRRIDAIQYWGWPLCMLVDRRFHFAALLARAGDRSGGD